jgi:hypothetical protein
MPGPTIFGLRKVQITPPTVGNSQNRIGMRFPNHLRREVQTLVSFGPTDA